MHALCKNLVTFNVLFDKHLSSQMRSMMHLMFCSNAELNHIYSTSIIICTYHTVHIIGSQIAVNELQATVCARKDIKGKGKPCILDLFTDVLS